MKESKNSNNYIKFKRTRGLLIRCHIKENIQFLSVQLMKIL